MVVARRSLLVSLLATVGLFVGLGVACIPEDDELRFRGDYTPGPEAWIPAPLPEAYCEILVEGVGWKDMEEDYLPHVITCENGGANFEALKAQAIAARSVAYYYMANAGSVCDSQGCQVYTCGSEPSAAAYQAVADTAGQYLNFNGVLTYAFYVAGDPNTSPGACVGDPNVGTEGWVTYNEGKGGTDVEQTALGWVFNPGDAGFGQNRGCMSQWGARCLENNNGYSTAQILRFYYGEDTAVTQAQGACVPAGDGDGDTTTTGDGDTTTTGDGDGDTTTTGDGDTTTMGETTWGDEDTGPEPDEGSCNVGGLGCECTQGGGCDPGLVCDEGVCRPEGPSAGGEDGTDGGTTDTLGPSVQDDAFDADQGCACTSEGSGQRGGPLGALTLLGLFAWRRRRPSA